MRFKDRPWHFYSVFVVPLFFLCFVTEIELLLIFFKYIFFVIFNWRHCSPTSREFTVIILLFNR